MKIKNGIVKNVNKKLVAGALIFTLSATTLCGCVPVVKKEEQIKHYTNEDGYTVGFSGEIEDSQLYLFNVYNIKNIKTGESYYTIVGKNYFELLDIFTLQNYNNSMFEIEFIDHVDNYLDAFSMRKPGDNPSYNEKEFRIILEKIEENENSKKLVKEK